jgi:hypothetical protein
VAGDGSSGLPDWAERASRWDRTKKGLASGARIS